MADRYFYGDNVNCYDTMYRTFYNIGKFSFGEIIKCVFLFNTDLKAKRSRLKNREVSI